MTNDSRLTQNVEYARSDRLSGTDALARHRRDGSGYAYCGQDHPGGDAEAREWCRVYHWPRMPKQIDSSGAQS